MGLEGKAAPFTSHVRRTPGLIGICHAWTVRGLTHHGCGPFVMDRQALRPEIQVCL